MKCRICGSEIDERNNWCPECGAEIKASGKELNKRKTGRRKKIIRCCFFIAPILIVAALIACIVFRFQSEEDDVGAIYYKEIDAEHIATEEYGIQYADNEILVVAKSDVSKRKIEKLAEKYNAKIVGWIEKTGDYQWELSGVYTLDELEEIQASLENETYVASASVNYIMEMEMESVDYDTDCGDEWREEFNLQGKAWGAEAINAPSAWHFLNQHKDEINPVRVGLIDSGFDTSHTDLEFAETFYNTSAGAHGTHVAGTMAARADNTEGICGIYPYGAGNLYGVSWIGTGENYEENKVSVMTEKCDFAELILRNVKVINCSYGYKDYNLYIFYSKQEASEEHKEEIQRDAVVLADFLDRCIKKEYDFVIVSAAGNQSNDTYELENENGELEDVNTQWVDSRYSSSLNAISKEYPDVYNRIIVVGSVGQEYNISSFSNTGERVDIYAPGEIIFSTTPNNTYQNIYKKEEKQYYWSGTSMAAPHVSGTVAMVWAVNNHLTGDEVKAIICKSVSGRGKEDYPMIDANLAVQYAYDTLDDKQPVPEPLNGAALCYVVNVDNEDEKVMGATVTAVSKSDGRTERTTTDENGHFELILLEGEYTLTVTHPEYKTYVLDITVKNEGVNYLDDWIKMEKDENYEIIRAKYEEILKEVDKNGILEECKEQFVCYDWEKDEYDMNIWGNPAYDEVLSDYPRYSPEESNFNFSIYDIDGDGTEELLVDWYDWYDWTSYGAGFIDILQYHPETDTLVVEGVIPTNRTFYNAYDSSYIPLFYDNGVIITQLPWINTPAITTDYVNMFEYNAASDSYAASDKYHEYEYLDRADANVWQKSRKPEIELEVRDTDGNLLGVRTVPFPDEQDLDGDGKLYCKCESENFLEYQCNEENFDLSQWKDIAEIEELNVPEGENHKLNIEWYHLHTYVETGEKVLNEISLSSAYGKIIYDYFSVNYNNYDLPDWEKEGICYSLSDLNYDGTDELIVGIASMNENTNTVDYYKMSIYTFQDGQAFLVAYDNDMQWTDYYICENGIRHCEGRGTGYYLDASVIHYYHNYGGDGSEEATEITEEEYNTIYDKYQEKQLELHYLTPEIASDLLENGVQ